MASNIANKSALTDKFRSAASNHSGRIHIVHATTGWAVKREGTMRASGVYPTKKEAINRAKEHKHYRGVIIIHKKDGSIHRWIRS
ncbi:MAG: DUF2188 domain-containing protein [Bacteroidota bacterium]